MNPTDEMIEAVYWLRWRDAYVSERSGCGIIDAKNRIREELEAALATVPTEPTEPTDAAIEAVAAEFRPYCVYRYNLREFARNAIKALRKVQ